MKIMPHFYRLSAQKWIHYSDAVVILAVVQIFGIKCAATQFHSDRNDRGSNLSLLKSIHFNSFIISTNIKRITYFTE